MTPDLDTLLAYHLGELDEAASAEVEESLFADADTARRLQAVVHLADALRPLARRWGVSAASTVEALARMERAGLAIRTYLVGPGQTVPCGPGPEDVTAVRLCGRFGRETVDLEVEVRSEGAEVVRERLAGVPVDPAGGDVVMAHPASYIRSLPRSYVHYLVRGAGGEPDREFFLDHDPARS